MIEVFSPPRFAQQTAIRGQRCLSADLTTGWDFRRADHRQAMRELVTNTPPELLICCPPCTWAGGWFHLNRLTMSEAEVREKQMLTALFTNFCCQLIEIQTAHGKRALFEHPKPSCVWKMPKMQKLCTQLHTVDCDMCMFGLKLPSGERIRKSTRLLINHESMKCLGRTCPGANHDSHSHHHHVAGHHPKVGSVSRFAGQYTQTFVRAVMNTVPSLRCQAVLTVHCHTEAECLVAARVRELNDESRAKMKESLMKLHENLGHPGNQHLVRILRHGGASSDAQDMARQLSCSQCEANARPKPALPAQPDRIVVFNQRIGVDVKYLTGWKVNQKVPAVNIIDYASSLQIMVPLFDGVNALTIRRAIQERWISWAGQPSEIVFDPQRANLTDALTNPQELAGSIIHVTAADAHYQLGKVEVHGGWFNHVLQKLLQDQNPNNKDAWLECVHASHCKNELIQVYGMTPAQYVFGRNPKIAENLLDEPLEVIPATAALYETEVARRVSVRQAARRAVLELQDNRALRLALNARPRHQPEFSPGMLIAYWRNQKWSEGVLNHNGRWYGPAIVLGKVGRNYVVVHKRQVIRCAPEQVRASTTEEKELVRAPHAELLGLKHAFESGQIASRQYVDLVPQGYPTEEPEDEARPEADSAPAHVPESVPNTGSEPAGELVNPSEASPGSEQQPLVARSETPADSAPTPPSEPTYGPIRRRIAGKNGPGALYRPAPMRADDFSDMMNEIMPELVGRIVDSTAPAEANMESPRGDSAKRSLSPDQDTESQPSHVLRSSGPASGSRDRPEDTEVLACAAVQPVSKTRCGELSQQDKDELLTMYHANVPYDVMLVTYHQKRGSKEIPHVNQPTEQQAKIDEAKLAEWHVIESKNAGRLVLGDEADNVRNKLSHRIMDSRYVVTLKQEEDAPVKIKARWCLLGHRDPDLSEKALAGVLQSPTLSQVSRSVLFQTIASKKWRLALGDVKGAFLASGPLPERYRPLYARLPPGGIPGVPADALIEVTGHVYGLNDSPSAWQQKLHRELLSVGFVASRCDPCFYTLRSPNGELCGVYGVHVDDCATGGEGPLYEEAMRALKEKFEFRKWRVLDGDFCGARYVQDPVSFDISMDQSKFANNIRPLHLSRTRCANKQDLLTDKEVSCLRAINGSLNWLSSQSRPDLATQVSFSQQSFPNPTVGDALAANNAVRRAKQHADLCIVYRSTPLEDMAVVCHSDAAYANAKGGATQGGYIIGFTHKNLEDGEICAWTPAYWKSHRLPRVVNSTLSAEAQSMSCASGMCEWMSLLLADVKFGPAYAQSLWGTAQRIPVMMITDCKSLYDVVHSPSAPSISDRRTAIDAVIIKEGIHRMNATLRWIPTDRMIADGLTKESADALDLLRACVKTGRYQVSPESDVLEWRANERLRRKQMSEHRAKFSALLVSLIKHNE